MRRKIGLIALLAIAAVLSLGGLVTANAHDGPAVVVVLDSPHSHGGVSAGGNPPAITLPATVQLDDLLVTDTNYSEEVRSDGLKRSAGSSDFNAKESEPRSRAVQRDYARG